MGFLLKAGKRGGTKSQITNIECLARQMSADCPACIIQSITCSSCLHFPIDSSGVLPGEIEMHKYWHRPRQELDWSISKRA